MQTGQAKFNLIEIKLQQKSPTIFYKLTNDYNKKRLGCGVAADSCPCSP
jgi:hypothetical protein